MNTTVEQPILLQRSPLWSRAVVWGIVSVTAFSLLWACLAKIDEAVPAMGKLEPKGQVKEIKVPLNGVVKQVHVSDGQHVKQGDLLLTLDPTTAEAQQTSLKTIRQSLLQENAFYQAAMHGRPMSASALAKVPSELAELTKSRSTLLAENQLYRAQLNPTANASQFTQEQQLRLRSAQTEVASRIAAARLEAAQLRQQLAETTVQLSGSKDILALNRGIYQDLDPVAKEGGIARVQYLKQQQEVRSRQMEVDQLTEQQARLKLAISQAEEKLSNTLAASQQELLNKIADNDKRLAEIDSQLNKAIVDNNKRIAETDSQLSQAEVTLKYQEIRAPADGTVFDLKVSSPGFVANSAEPVLKVVPDNLLVAEVYITNKDIGFVREGMPVDIRVDSFPFSEFGDIKGKLLSIGSDALPPTEIRPFYTFPAKVQLDKQVLSSNGRQLPLQSGMSVSVNIKVRQRTVMSILTSGFTQQVESLKNVR